MLQQERNTEMKRKESKNIADILNLRQYAMVIALLFICVIFTALTSKFFTNFSFSFISARNLSNLSRQMAATAVISIGATLVIISGGIDLSVGALLGLCSLISALLMKQLGASTFVAVFAAIFIGTIFGFLQGIIIARSGMPPFIVTLGSSMFFLGVMLIIGKGTTISSLNPSFLTIGQGYISPLLGYFLASIAIIGYVFSLYSNNKSRKKYQLDTNRFIWIKAFFVSSLIIGTIMLFNSYQGLAIPVLIMIIIAIVFNFLAEKTTIGRNIYSVGDNPLAALFAGIDVAKTKIIVYTIMGFLAGVGAVILTARLAAASPAVGTTLAIDTIAAAVIGGASLMGGQGKVTGALLGAIVMASIENGMSLMNIESAWQYVVKGIVLVVAVGFDIYSSKNK
jgi:D-xylose transport system permease protein